MSEPAKKVKKLGQEMSVLWYDNAYEHHIHGDEKCLTECESLTKMELFKSLDNQLLT